VWRDAGRCHPVDSEAAMFRPFELLAAALLGTASCAAAHAGEPTPFIVTQDAPDCLMMIDMLRPVTGNAEIDGPDGTDIQSGLLARLDDATQAFTEGRAADSARALIDYLGRLHRLRTDGRISSDDATPLIEGAREAEACVLEGRA